MLMVLMFWILFGDEGWCLCVFFHEVPRPGGRKTIALTVCENCLVAFEGFRLILVI